jgi:hypothetical protein
MGSLFLREPTIYRIEGAVGQHKITKRIPGECLLLDIVGHCE